MTPSDRLEEIGRIIEGRGKADLQSIYESSSEIMKTEAIKFKDGRIRVIEYVRVSLPATFERRGRRFARAWGPWKYPHTK